jgi:hypothetical protein
VSGSICGSVTCSTPADVHSIDELRAAVIGYEIPIISRVRARSDIGEILASELTEERLDFNVPVRRMRYGTITAPQVGGHRRAG